jgi:hypothetical protein
MVEILGVLSIISVLSVGGINAYSTAIKKHKANELLKQTSMHAVEVSSQIMSGKEPTGLSDFGTGIAIRLNTTNLNGKTTFKLILSDIDGDVCEQLKSMKGGMVRDVTCDDTSTTLTFYKNLATNDIEGAKSPTGEKVDAACKDVECEEGLTCFHGECKCSNGAFKCGDKCCSEGSYCAQGDDTSRYTCVIPTGECTKNSDCDDGEYCRFSDATCTGPTGGVCTDKETLTTYTLKLPAGDLTLYKSSNTMRWWNALNLCQAHNKQMVTMSDLGIQDTENKRSCYYDNTQVNYITHPCICNGGLDNDCFITNKAITNTLGTSGWIWLSDNALDAPCYTRSISLDNGGIYGSGNRSSTYSALCRDP